METVRKKKTSTTKEKQEQARLEWLQNENRKTAHRTALRAGSPTRQYEKGEKVRYGGWDKAIIKEKYENGLYYEVLCEGKNAPMTELAQTQLMFVPWVKLFPTQLGDSAFTSNEDIRINYTNSSIESLLSRHLLTGVDFSPEYQRGLVWTDEDREALLDSIFMGADIGRFVFRERDDDEIDLADAIFYEIVDGKQRMTALLDYYAGRYAYHGVYYHELSSKDRHRFDNACVSVASVKNLSKKDTLRLFLMLNQGGRPLSRDVIERAKQRMDELSTLGK